MSEFLRGKVALVTGASRGLGRAIAVSLAREGAHVALVGRDAAKLAETEKLAGAAARPLLADLTVEAAVLDLEKRVRAELGPVQIVVNNAGVNLRKPLVDFTLAEWRHIIDSNLTSAFLVSRSFIPHMKGTGYGRIVNIASTMSHASLPLRSAYSSSKTALLGMTRALALELAQDGITVNSISPGPFATEMNTEIVNDPAKSAWLLSKCPLGQWGHPEDIGALAVHLCSEAGRFITGTDVAIDGGWLAT